MSPLTLLELTFRCNFYFFFPDSPTEVTRAWILAHNGSKYALWRKEVPFWVHTMADKILGVQIPPKPSKWPSIGTFYSCHERLRDESRHRRLTSLSSFRRPLAVVGRAAYTVYSILGITAVLYFPMITIYNATIVSADALYSVRKFSFCEMYSIQYL